MQYEKVTLLPNECLKSQFTHISFSFESDQTVYPIYIGLGSLYTTDLYISHTFRRIIWLSYSDLGIIKATVYYKDVVFYGVKEEELEEELPQMVVQIKEISLDIFEDKLKDMNIIEKTSRDYRGRNQDDEEDYGQMYFTAKVKENSKLNNTYYS